MPNPNDFITGPNPLPPGATGPDTQAASTGTPSNELLPEASTSPAFNQTPSAPTDTFDLSPHEADTDFESQMPGSGMGADLSAPSTPSFIPTSPASMPQAAQWNVTSEQTVAGQFASIMDSDNPAFKIVQEAIVRQHAAAGGANSLMAARSAQMAVADVGFKIASQDAATFARSAEFNAAMKNQFGLAEQQFMHNAMLSEQNFKQGVVMLREQHTANLEQIHADLSSRMKLMGLEANINLQMEGVKQQNILAQIDKNHRNALEGMEAQFEYNWETAEQSQRQALERMDRETSNELYKNEGQFSQQMQLNYMSELSQNSRMLLSAMGEIGGNPNITAAQASSAMQDVLRQYNAVNAQLAAVYSVPSVGGLSTGYLNFAKHRVGYGANTEGDSSQIPFYGGGETAPAGGYPQMSDPLPAQPAPAPPAPAAPAPAPPAAPPAAPPTAPPVPVATNPPAGVQPGVGPGRWGGPRGDIWYPGYHGPGGGGGGDSMPPQQQR